MREKRNRYSQVRKNGEKYLMWIIYDKDIEKDAMIIEESKKHGKENN